MKEVMRASFFKGLRALLEELGGNADQLFAAVGIDERDYERPERFVSPRPLYKLLNIAAERLQRSDLGLLWGERADLSYLGPLYIAQTHAESGREALELGMRYLHVHNQALHPFMTPLPGGEVELVGMRIQAKAAAPLAQMYERNVVVLHRVLGEVCGRAYRPAEVWLPHARMSPGRVYQRVFSVEPQFNREQAGIVVERRMLDAFRPDRNQQLRHMAEEYLRSFGPRADASLAAETADMIRILFRSSDCSPAEVARALGMHERTLQRRLRSEGASFEQIKDDIRRELTESLLSEPELPLTQIAFMLYYANSSAFSRACRRWFDRTPSMMRRTLLQDRAA